MKQHNHLSKGFVLSEMLVAIAFLVILTTATYLFLFTKGRGVKDMESATVKIAALLREANSRAIAQSEGVRWGVRFEMGPDGRGRYILFAGATTTANFREFVTMPATLRFDTSTFIGSDRDIIFERGTGRTNTSTVIRVRLVSDPLTSSAVEITPGGLINTYSGPTQNVALGKTATQSSDWLPGTADKGVDGNTSGLWGDYSIFHTNLNPAPSWWEVDLGQSYLISQINLWNRTDCCLDRIEDYYVIVSNTPNPTITTPGVWINHQLDDAGTPTTIPVNYTGRYVRIIFDASHNPQYLHLAEVEVFSP